MRPATPFFPAVFHVRTPTRLIRAARLVAVVGVLGLVMAAFADAAAAATNLAVNDVAVGEGNAGTATLTFTITRSGDTTGTSSLTVATQDNTAVAPVDYVALAPTTVNFAANQTTATVAVTVNGDTTVEPNERFYLKLSAPVGATIIDATGVGTIVSNDTGLAVDNVSVTEGNAGTKTATFTVTRSGRTVGTSSVSVATLNDTAVAPGDYVALAPTAVSFAANQKTATVAVTINGDSTVELTERYYVKLSAPVSAMILDDTGVGTIVADDTGLAVNNVSVTEGDSGTSTATFTITRTGDRTGTSSVTAATQNGTATTPSDYVALAPTTVNFAADQITASVAVTVNGDTTVEPTETYSLKLSAPVGAAILDDTGVGTIVTDDIDLVVNDVSVTEGNAGTKTATFTITRTGIVTGTSSVTVATLNGTATAGSDYVAVAPTSVNFAANQTTRTVAVTINGDTSVEADETYSLKLSSPVGARILDDTGLGTIVNDDTELSVDDISVDEGNAGTKTATFTITRSGDKSGTASVSATTINGTATAGSDYVAVAPTVLNFAVNQATASVAVTINGDITAEVDEAYSLKLSAASGANLVDDTGAGTIFNDESSNTQTFAYTVGNTVSNGVPAAGAGNIEVPTAIDKYTFTGTAGQQVFVAILTSHCSLRWSMTGPGDVSVFVNVALCGDPGAFTLPSAGTYTIRATTPSSTTGVYGFRVTNIPAPQAFAYTVGNTVSNGVPAAGAGNIELPGAIDTYTFTGTAGQQVFVAILSSHCGLRWSMTGPGDVPVFATVALCGDPGAFTLPSAGTYTIRASAPTNSAVTGIYSFRVTNIPAPQAFAYTVGNTVSNGVPAAGAGNIELPGAIDTYTFTGTAGQQVFVAILSSHCGLRWSMTGPGDVPVFATVALCGDPGAFTLPSAGTYTIRASAPSNSAVTGIYSFRVTNIPAPQAFAYTVGNTVSNGVPAAGAGNIELPGAIDTYTFTGTAGQQVFVAILSSHCGLRWSMTGPGDVPVFASVALCGDPGAFTLPSAGTYTIRASAPANSAVTGIYSFRVTNIPAPQAFAYTVGNTVSNGVPGPGAGNIELPGAIDTYTFTGTAGQQVFVAILSSHCGLRWSMTGPGDVPVFATVALCGDPGAFTLPSAGTYTIRASAPTNSAVTGTYSFKIT